MNIPKLNSMCPGAHESLLGTMLAGGLDSKTYLFPFWDQKNVEHFWVSGEGNDQNHGQSPTAPLLKIQRAIDLASTLKTTIVHLIGSFSAAGTKRDHDDDAIHSASVTTGNQRLINTECYIYKSDIHFIGEGPLGYTVIKPGAALTAGIFAIKTGLARISFQNIVLDMTTAANEAIYAVGTVDDLHIIGNRFIVGLDVIDLDQGLCKDAIIAGNEFFGLSAANGDYISIAPIRGKIVGNYIYHNSANASTGYMIGLANTASSGFCVIEDNILHGGDITAGTNIMALGIAVVGANSKYNVIRNNSIFGATDYISDGGTDCTLIGNNTEAGGTDATNIATDLTHIKL